MAGAVACLVSACVAMPTDGASVPVEPVLSGRHSGVYKQYFTLIRDRETFETVWRRATARQYPAPAPPSIDFSRYMVIAVFLGEKRTGGYDIEIADLSRTPAGLLATVRERHPGAGCHTTEALTQPFEIVKTPVTAAPVEFKRQIVADPCD
ncbi:MAG TPA: protease complex subunit PrcB family protein [Gammaproteobacteria bacterium]|nr:protease complex subunit PrcB family protein [Gammaproteobacteria bacterium]